MSVRIGYIGSEHSVARLTQAAAQLSGVTLRCYPYENPQQTTAQYRRALAENDAVCFSGTISYYHRARELDGDTPVLVAKFSQYSLVASLLSATSCTTAARAAHEIGDPAVAAPRSPRDRAFDPALDISDISIDVPDPEIAAAVVRDTGIQLTAAQIADYRWVYGPVFSRPVDVEDLVRFHEQRAELAGARLAITSVHAVYDRLRAAKRPVMYMIDSLQHDLDLVSTAQQRVSVQRLEGSLLAVIYLTTSAPQKRTSPTAELRDSLAAQLARFATPVQHKLASWQQSGLDMFYTTRAELDAHMGAITDAMHHGLPPRGDSATQPHSRLVHVSDHAISLGAGVGRHLYEAEDRALQALRRAVADLHTSAYLVDEQARVQDLLGVTAAEGVRHTEPWLIELAASAGMQARSITRLLAFLARRDFEAFTAAEWAAASRTSQRTAERTVRKLLDVNALVITGQEHPLDAGRPRTVYTLAEPLEAAARQLRPGTSAPTT